MLRSLGGKSVSTMLGLNITLKSTCFVCVCVIMQAPCIVPEIISPQLHVCVHGDPH